MRIDGVLTSAVNPVQNDSSDDQVFNNSKDNAVEPRKTANDIVRKNKINEEELISTIESANDSIQIHNRSLKFTIHEKTKEIMVKVVDTNTDEVIREIPPEKILDMVAKLWEMAGILVDEKV